MRRYFNSAEARRTVPWVGLGLIVALPVLPLEYPGSPVVKWVCEVCFRLLVVALGWRVLRADRICSAGDQAPAVSSDTDVPDAILEPTPTAASQRAAISGLKEQAYRAAQQQISEFEGLWRSRASEFPASDADDARQQGAVAHLAGRIADALDAEGERPQAVLHIRGASLRLGAAAAAPGHPGRPGLSAFLQPLTRVETWRGDPRFIPGVDYLVYVANYVEEALKILDARESQLAGDLDWRRSAEDLLRVVESRRPAREQADPLGYRTLHQGLLELLDFEELQVSVGDSIDRSIHDIDSYRETRELPPNRVLQVVAPGYRSRGPREIRRKATVVASEQCLD